MCPRSAARSLLPESVTAIGSYAFAWCSAIVALNIPSRVTEIGEYAFEQCINWQGSVVVPYGVTKINKRTFDFCASLTDITLPRSITEIGEYAFCGCHTLTELVSPEGVTEIDQMAFYSSQGLRSLVIPSSVTRIGVGAIGFTNIDTIYYTGTEEQWNRIVFRDTYDYSESTQIVFGWTGNSAVEYTISFDANGGSGLMDAVVVEKGTKYLLPDCLFIAPAGKQFKAWRIGGTEFAAGDRITVSGDTTITAVWGNAVIVASGTCGGNLILKLTESGVLTISGKGAMTASPEWLYSGYSGNLLLVVVENGVTSVGDNAFSGCSNLQRVVLPGSVISIGGNAFNGCKKLTKLTLPTSLTDIGSRAFYGCESLQSVVLPDSVTSIGDYAFAWCGNLDSLHIPAKVTSIGCYVFRSCCELYELTVDSNNPAFRTQDGMLFSGDMTQLLWCPNNGAVRMIPDGVIKICDGAFGECEDLQAVHVPASVKIIGEAILHDAVRKVYFAGTEQQWSAVEIGGMNYNLPSYLFCMGSIVTEGACGDSVTWKIAGNTLTISGTGSMYDFEQNGSPWQDFDCWITSVVVENGVTSIGKFALFNCTILESITIPVSVTKIGASYCPALKTVCYGGTKEQWTAIANNSLSSAEVVFAVNEPEKSNPFTDVPADAYYYDSVLWAYENGVTKGTSDTEFSPTATCTRGQVVTFLWRAKGCPEPTGTVNPFTDVTEKDYFYKAVLWAVENGITNGTSATTFGPKDTCTSGHVLTFLWRANGKPAAVGKSTLDAANAGQWYSKAVAWADTTGLLSGMGDGFSVMNQSPRADIVTYLYRDAVKRES